MPRKVTTGGVNWLREPRYVVAAARGTHLGRRCPGDRRERSRCRPGERLWRTGAAAAVGRDPALGVVDHGCVRPDIRHRAAEPAESRADKTGRADQGVAPGDDRAKDPAGIHTNSGGHRGPEYM
jgi:hypothetical protein